MKDVKPKIINRYELSSVEKSDKSRKPIKKYPNITIDLSALPEAKDWEINKEYNVTLRLRMTGLSIRKQMKDSRNDYIDDWGNNASFDITGTEVSKQSTDSGKDKDDDDSTED